MQPWLQRNAAIRHCVVASMALFATGCGSSSKTVAPPPTLRVEWERVAQAGLDPIRVRMFVTDGAGAVPSLQSDLGMVSQVTAVDGESFVATITPTQTGEHRATVTLGDLVVVRTPLVLQEVHEQWDQPMAVEGLVNTPGYEDGVTITPDGEYLFVQYGAVRWSSFLVFELSRASGGCGGNRLVPTRCNHPWIDTALGPMSSPERPGFFTARFQGNQLLHSAASWGMGPDTVPFLAWTTMFYGFRRQADGSFAEPFPVAFDDSGDGIVGPFGLSFLPLREGVYRSVFSLKDLATGAGGFDLYTCDLIAGVSNGLGSYATTSPGNPPIRSLPFPSSHVNLGDNSGTQGNASLYAQGGVVQSIWTDDEYDQDADTFRITVHTVESGVFPATASYGHAVLPGAVHTPGTTAIQPTFTGTGLWFTRDSSVAYAAYAGDHSLAGFRADSNWSAPFVVLQKDTTISSLFVNPSDVGKIVAVGEPTLAGNLLYFVYARVRGIDPITGLADLDFQAGWVRRR